MDWAICRPTRAFGACISNWEFHNWLQFCCHVPLFELDAGCPRSRCGTILDVFGDHLRHWEHASYRIWRHDTQDQLLAPSLFRAALLPFIDTSSCICLSSLSVQIFLVFPFIETRGRREKADTAAKPKCLDLMEEPRCLLLLTEIQSVKCPERA